MKVRRANEGDILKMSRLWVDMVKELEPGKKPNMSWWQSTILERLRYNKEYVCFVADKNDKIVGFADFSLRLEPTSNTIIAVANHMYMAPEERKSKTGWEVEQKCLEVAKARGATQILFETTDTDRWTRHGFTAVRTVMSKELI